MKTPMDWCAAIFPRAQISARSPEKNLPPSFERLIIALANASATDHLTKSFRKPSVVRLECESTQACGATALVSFLQVMIEVLRESPNSSYLHPGNSRLQNALQWETARAFHLNNLEIFLHSYDEQTLLKP